MKKTILMLIVSFFLGGGCVCLFYLGLSFDRNETPVYLNEEGENMETSLGVEYLSYQRIPPSLLSTVLKPEVYAMLSGYDRAYYHINLEPYNISLLVKSSDSLHNCKDLLEYYDQSIKRAKETGEYTYSYRDKEKIRCIGENFYAILPGPIFGQQESPSLFLRFPIGWIDLSFNLRKVSNDILPAFLPSSILLFDHLAKEFGEDEYLEITKEMLSDDFDVGKFPELDEKFLAILSHTMKDYITTGKMRVKIIKGVYYFLFQNTPHYFLQLRGGNWIGGLERREIIRELNDENGKSRLLKS